MSTYSFPSDQSNDPILQKEFYQEYIIALYPKKSFCFSNSPMLMLEFNDRLYFHH
jgi:hypothetical protein